jgi:fluoroquinolone resistance protein
MVQVADRKHEIPAPATTSTVRSADRYGRDLSGERHEKVAFIDVDLSETVDDGGVFTECAFRGARFNVSRRPAAQLVIAAALGLVVRED